MAKGSVIPGKRVVETFEKGLSILNLPRRLEGIGARRGGTSVFFVVRQIIAGLLNQSSSLLRGVDRSRGLVRGSIGEDTIYRTLASRAIQLWQLLPRLGSRENTFDQDLLVIDDSPIAKPRARRMAGLSFHFSTTERKPVHGLCLVGLYHVGAALRGFVGMKLKIGSVSIPRTGRRGRPSNEEQESRDKTKSELALELIKAALAAGNRALRVVFDSAYFGRPFLLALKQLGITAYTRARANNVFWIDGVKWKALDWARAMRSWKIYRNSEIRYSSALAIWNGLGFVRLVRVQCLPTGEKRSQYAVLVCTDTRVSAAEIIRVYLERWCIEVEFRNAKTECGLEKVHVRSFQSIMNYLVCSLLGVRLLRMMERLLRDTGCAVPRLLELLRLAMQRAIQESSTIGVGERPKTMIPTGFVRIIKLRTMISSGLSPGCGT